MLNMLRNRHLSAVLSLCLLTAVLLLLTGSAQEAEQLQVAGQLPSYKVQGPMKVYYQYRTSDNGSTGTGDTPREAEEIIFFDKYVIVKTKNGSGTFIPVDKIINLGSHPIKLVKSE